MKEVILYCDGSAIGNPGPGGWGVVILEQGRKKEVKELGGFSEHTTNNRMELTAAIQGLMYLPEKTSVTVKTDSQYVIRGITGWVFGWERNGWLTTQKKEVLNKDLWEELLSISKKHTIVWEHVRAHQGIALNERVDMIAHGFAGKEQVTLFNGDESAYSAFLRGMPKARVASSSASKKGKAYAYVSLVSGVVATHATWAECEKRVKGEKSKYKKVFSKEEETALIAEWKT